jgi:hypothetical protein
MSSGISSGKCLSTQKKPGFWVQVLPEVVYYMVILFKSVDTDAKPG